jgi:hypothetical protein
MTATAVGLVATALVLRHEDAAAWATAGPLLVAGLGGGMVTAPNPVRFVSKGGGQMPPEEQHEHDPQYEAPTTWVCSICGRSFGLGSEFEINISMQRKHEEYHLKDMIDDLEELLALEAAINV